MENGKWKINHAEEGERAKGYMKRSIVCALLLGAVIGAYSQNDGLVTVEQRMVEGVGIVAHRELRSGRLCAELDSRTEGRPGRGFLGQRV